MDCLSLVSSKDKKCAIYGDGEAEKSPKLVHQSVTTAIYRLEDKGIKVALDRNLSHDQIIRKLLHEQNISNFLPSSCRKRRVIDVTVFHRQPALTFKWDSGMTLKKWIDIASIDTNVHLNVRLRVAMAITKTLSDFHDGGVMYNTLTPENIVLAPVGGDFAATFIDLSSAFICEKGNSNIFKVDAQFERRAKDRDLTRLGLVLNALFGEEEDVVVNLALGGEGEPATQSDPDFDRRKRGKQARVGEGLPLYLASLISTLLKGKKCASSFEPFCYGYTSAKDVYLDLKVLLESNSNSCLRMFDNLDGSAISSQMRLHKGMFYGRQVQMSMLSTLCQSVFLMDKPLLAMISGPSGVGKSTLANQIKKPFAVKCGYFIDGKFEKADRPDTVLTSALNSFFGELIEADARHASQFTKWSVRDIIGNASGSDLKSIPNLQKWLAEENDVHRDRALLPSRNKVTSSSIRLKFLLCKIIGAIACKVHPVILFLDDLQWADEMTLDVIRMMMIDPDIHNFLFLGSYRENEVDCSHPLSKKLHDIKEQGTNIVTIAVGQIERECVNTLVSETLCIPPSLCRPLSTVVHNKCCGIILFVWNFLAYLHDEGLLSFSMTHRQWLYDLSKIREEEIQQDVLLHITEHMIRHVSKQIQIGLKFCACLGPSFDGNVLEMATKGANSNTCDVAERAKATLEFCVNNGFFRAVGPNGYVWAHDQIQQAAYDLIPLPKRDAFHLLVGSRIVMNSSPSELEDLIYIVVDNMNRGSKLIEDIDQRHDAASLNLQAGEKSLQASAFHSAANFFLSGISLLEDESWETHYRLTIGLYDAASEALFVTGDFSELSFLIEKPLANAHSFEDKLNTYNNLIRSLAASSKYEEGTMKCFDILAQLGESIPTDITADIYRDEALQVKRLLNKKSLDLLSLPLMTDTKKMAAMQFMNHVLIMTWSFNPKLNHILVFRMASLSILHGISNLSCFAFACYGAWLVSEPTCDIEGGHRMGRVATELMNKLGAHEIKQRVCLLVYGFINIWKEPWQACLDKHLEAYESGLCMGDIEYAIANLYYRAITAIDCGETLGKLSQYIVACAKSAFQHNFMTLWRSSVINHQLILDLMGIEQNAFTPYNNGVTEESCFASAHQSNEIAVCRLICMRRKYLAFFKGDLDTAEAVHELSQEYSINSRGSQTITLVSIFIDGLIALFLAMKHCKDEEKWAGIGFRALESMKKWRKYSDWNFSNKLFLLEAEYSFLKQDHKRAIYCYHASITSARQHHFIHEEGLAEEKFASYLLHKRNNEGALERFCNAKKCYQKWGAHALVQNIDKTISALKI